MITVNVDIVLDTDDEAKAVAIAHALADRLESTDGYVAEVVLGDYTSEDDSRTFRVVDEPHLRAAREKPVHGPEERLAGQRLSMGRVPMLREPKLDVYGALDARTDIPEGENKAPVTEGHTSRQLSQAAGVPTEGCKRYGCHICPTPGHQNEGRCNRCGREA